MMVGLGLRIGIVLFVAFLTACASTGGVREQLENYVGNSVDEAYRDFGRPSGVYNMQDGTWQHLWTQQSKTIKGGKANWMGVPLATSSRSQCTRILIVDKHKKVIGFDTEGKC